MITLVACLERPSEAVIFCAWRSIQVIAPFVVPVFTGTCGSIQLRCRLKAVLQYLATNPFRKVDHSLNYIGSDIRIKFVRIRQMESRLTTCRIDRLAPETIECFGVRSGEDSEHRY